MALVGPNGYGAQPRGGQLGRRCAALSAWSSALQAIGILMPESCRGVRQTWADPGHGDGLEQSLGRFFRAVDQLKDLGLGRLAFLLVVAEVP